MELPLATGAACRRCGGELIARREHGVWWRECRSCGSPAATAPAPPQRRARAARVRQANDAAARAGRL